jgi:hypothetical protein
MRHYLLFLIICCLAACVERTENLSQQDAVGKPDKVELEHRKNLTLSPAEYLSWVNKKQNGLNREKEFGEIKYNLKSKPIEYIVCNELRQDAISKNQFDSLSAELSGMQYFDFKISIEKFTKEFLKYHSDVGMSYEERVSYCSFNMQKDIKMVVDADTIPCVLYHFERAFDVVPYGVFLLGFPKAPKDKDFTIVVTDNLFNNGILKYSFHHDLFNYLPKLECI